LKEDGTDTTTTTTTSADIAGSAAATPANEDEKNNKKCDDSSTTKDNDVISNNSNSNDNEEYSMLQCNLRNLYQSAKKLSHPNKINILLRTEPQSAKIESMFPLFGLSRSLVEDRPNLRHT
jgi:superfamily I DNA/RNA helicase